jgi:hypothetical protein
VGDEREKVENEQDEPDVEGHSHRPATVERPEREAVRSESDEPDVEAHKFRH